MAQDKVRKDMTPEQVQELDEVFARARRALEIIETYDQARVDRLCQAVAWAVDVVGMFVSAEAVEDAVSADLARAGRDPQEYYDRVHQYFAALPADRFPVIAALVPQLMTGSGDERFRFGLDLLVGGLAALASAARRPAAP